MNRAGKNVRDGRARVARWTLCALAAVIALALPGVPGAPGAAAHAGVATELAEWLVRQGGRYVDDVAGRSAKVLAQELEALASKAGSEAIEQSLRRGGPGTLPLLRELGEAAPDAARLIAAHGPAGRLLVEQGKGVAVEAFKQFGDDGVRVMLAQGAERGGQMLRVYGQAAAREGMSTTAAARLAHWAPTLERADPGVRATFVEKLRAGGDDFVLWVHKRWKPLAVAGGLTIAGITAYRVGDGVVGAMPDPSANPVGWLVWWTPLLLVVLIVAGAWLLRHTLAAWLRARALARAGAGEP